MHYDKSFMGEWAFWVTHGLEGSLVSTVRDNKHSSSTVEFWNPHTSEEPNIVEKNKIGVYRWPFQCNYKMDAQQMPLS